MEEIGLVTGNDPRIGGRYSLTFLMLMLSTAPMLAAAGSATAGSTVPQEPPPEISLAADPMAVGYEGTTKLVWSVTHANSCTAGGAWSGAKLDVLSFAQNRLIVAKHRTVTLCSTQTRCLCYCEIS